MAQSEIAWPKKTREIKDYLVDSTRWNDFVHRSDDIIVASWSKAGTTWVQQIVAQLISNGEETSIREISRWLDLTAFPKDEVFAAFERQTNRRVIKTHLPVDALGIRPELKYIYVARDGRDIVFSLHTFMAGFNLAESGGRNGAGPPPVNPDVRGFFLDWLDGRVHHVSPFFENVQGWWNIRQLPNVLLVHYASLKGDMEAEIHRIARFLSIGPSADAWPKIVAHCSFDYMKNNADSTGPKGTDMRAGGSSSFFHKGTNGRWRDVLTDEDIARYESAVAANLTPDCAHWLKTGELPRENANG
jgi:aryl sulfotransferase